MKLACIIVAFPLLFLGQTGNNLDVMTLNGRPCPLEGTGRTQDVKELNENS